MSTSALPAVERSLTVDVPVDWAFSFFTEKIGDWWPLQDYSVFAMDGHGRPDTVVFEPGVGGRVFERLGEEEALWGEVRVWEPPSRIVFSWKPNREWPETTEVEITFSPEGSGTRVLLQHRGWDRLGEWAERSRENYASGWGEVLGHYEEAVAK